MILIVDHWIRDVHIFCLFGSRLSERGLNSVLGIKVSKFLPMLVHAVRFMTSAIKSRLISDPQILVERSVMYKVPGWALCVALTIAALGTWGGGGPSRPEWTDFWRLLAWLKRLFARPSVRPMTKPNWGYWWDRTDLADSGTDPRLLCFINKNNFN